MKTFMLAPRSCKVLTIKGWCVMGWLMLSQVSFVAAQQLLLHATLESIGGEVLLPPGFDPDQTAVATMRYRISGGNWRQGFPFSLITWNGTTQFRGSIFRATPGMSYDMEVTIRDSTPVFSETVLNGTISTRPEPTAAATQTLRYVSPNGSGNAYTFSQPGQLQALLAAPIGCGTTILLREGEYAVGDLQVTLSSDCAAGAPIVFMAVPGETPVLNGGDSTAYSWTPHPADSNLYFTTVAPGLENGALCLLDGKRLYPYASLTEIFPGYPSLTGLQYRLPGYYRRGLNYFIKTPDGQNPNGKTVVLSRYLQCLRVYGNGKRNFLYFKGLTFKYYGKGSCNYLFGDISQPVECFPSAVLDLRDVSDAVIDGCTFWFNNNPIIFSGQTSRNVVQNCYLYDQTGLWPHAAFKQSRDAWAPLLGLPGDFGSFGRYLENAGVLFQPGTNVITENVLRHNRIDGYVIGVGTAAGGASPSEHDISDNDISHAYDGIESTSGFANHRVWGNRVHHGPVGMSMALPAVGPFYVFRNVFDHLSSRFNYLNPSATDGGDPHWLDCENREWPVSWSTALKLNIGGTTPNPGDIFFLHNTVHGLDSLSYNLYLWENTWKRLVSRNNIYETQGRANTFFDGIQGLYNYHFDSENDNYYSPAGTPASILRPVHGQPLCIPAASLEDFQYQLRDATDSPNVRIAHALAADPMFQDIDTGNFQLQPGSGIIDAGVVIPGINDGFWGAAPDIGAFELLFSGVEGPSIQETFHWVVYPNPSNGAVFIQSEIPICQVDVFDVTGRLISRQMIDNQLFICLDLTAQGICWLRGYTTNGQVSTLKLVLN